ncbi:MAG: NusG domain II-containing protein [Ruminococcaceae bacterium]|nr:NusG domain II-containing protein [Oscillospiraceae bacterium]
MEKKRTKNDILLIGALLLLALAAWGGLSLSRKAGGEAVIVVNGETYASLPLKTDAQMVLSPGNGFDAACDHTNTVIIRDGRVCVVDANCRDHICENRGWIEFDGESIVCLPHRLVVSVSGGEARGVDAAAG